MDVVLTGIGLLTPLGTDLPCLDRAAAGDGSAVRPWDDLLEGQSIAAARVQDVGAREVVGSPQLRRMDRMGHMAAVAGAFALRHAGADGSLPWEAERVAIGWATELAAVELATGFQERIRTRGPRSATPMTFPSLVQSAIPGYLSIIFALRGPSVTHCHHEACGLESLTWATHQIRAGRADAALVGVTEEIGPVLVLARRLAGAAEPPGEGAVALVLERADIAANRGARALARIAGEGAATHPMAPHRYATPGEEPPALPHALQQAGIEATDLVETLGRGRSLAATMGASPILSLLHVASLAHRQTLPAAVVVDARGGSSRAVVLDAPCRAAS
jgi:3-oxoacyl-[acyl-carrier-protein] synthase II